LKYGWSYNTVPVPLFMSAFLGSLYFTVSCWTQYHRLRTLYEICRENQKLTDEIKQLLQIFPECVIIRTSQSSKKINKNFTNQKFRNHICDIRRELKELDKVSVSFIQENEKNFSCSKVKTSLSNLLEQQEKTLTENVIIEKNGVKIRCNAFSTPHLEGSDTINSEESDVRTFNIKSQKVCWEGDYN
jgi:succinate dehydrogenase flavin-adding protein (antitoxin of CptAB toxin-antitoxin module)